MIYYVLAVNFGYSTEGSGAGANFAYIAFDSRHLPTDRQVRAELHKQVSVRKPIKALSWCVEEATDRKYL